MAFWKGTSALDRKRNVEFRNVVSVFLYLLQRQEYSFLCSLVQTSAAANNLNIGNRLLVPGAANWLPYLKTLNTANSTAFFFVCVCSPGTVYVQPFQLHATTTAEMFANLTNVAISRMRRCEQPSLRISGLRTQLALRDIFLLQYIIFFLWWRKEVWRHCFALRGRGVRFDS